MLISPYYFDFMATCMTSFLGRNPVYLCRRWCQPLWLCGREPGFSSWLLCSAPGSWNWLLQVAPRSSWRAKTSKTDFFGFPEILISNPLSAVNFEMFWRVFRSVRLVFRVSLCDFLVNSAICMTGFSECTCLCGGMCSCIYLVRQLVRQIFPIFPAFAGACAPFSTWFGNLYDRFFQFFLVLLRFSSFGVGLVIFLNFKNYLFLVMHLLDK